MKMRVLAPVLVALFLAPAVLAAPLPGARVFHPTRMRYMPENDQAWYARWYLLSQAEHSIDITYFNLYKDLFGKALLGLLHRKATEGVHIRLMVDSRGSMSLATRFMAQRYLREMASFPNVEVRIYKPLFGGLLKIPRDLRRVVASNHDKIMLVDGKRAVIGGRNLGEHYFASPEDDEGSYLDHDLLLEGAGVAGRIQEAFELEFENLDNLDLGFFGLGEEGGLVREIGLARDVMERWMVGEGLMDPEALAGKDRRTLRQLNEAMELQAGLTGFREFRDDPWAGEQTLPVEVLDKSSFGQPANDITERMLGLFDSAEHSILIQNAYLVLTPRLFDAFERASDRGVDITILTNSPASTHNLLVQAFFVKEWKYLLRDIPRLSVFMATDRHKIHAKTFVIDERVVSIGSYNLDPMSESINSELMALVDSPAFARQVRQRLEAQLSTTVKCEIRIGPDGEPIGVVGPDDYLSGIAGFLIRILGKIQFLRALV